jgi:hypothetical protein
VESGYFAVMTDEKKDQRLQLVVAPSDVAAVDEWRRKQPDLPSRSEAIRRLIHAGIAASAA